MTVSKLSPPWGDCLEDLRCPKHTRHSLVQMIRQRVYQIAAGYEDCNDADYLRIDPALRLGIGKDHKVGAGQSMLSRWENDVRDNVAGLTALKAALTRSMEWLIKRLIKVGARVSYHARRLYVHVASAFPLSHHYRAFLAWSP